MVKRFQCKHKRLKPDIKYAAKIMALCIVLKRTLRTNKHQNKNSTVGENPKFKKCLMQQISTICATNENIRTTMYPAFGCGSMWNSTEAGLSFHSSLKCNCHISFTQSSPVEAL
jgi:hypothetical protein